jgi:hypothetical protein
MQPSNERVNATNDEIRQRGLFALSGCHGPCWLGRVPTPRDALAELTDADH